MNVMEELIEDGIDRSYVERRVEDWEARVAELYANVKIWLPAGWRAWENGSVPMHEELMQRFNIPERRLPVLKLKGTGDRHGWLEPRGLWIIGANGRIDLILPPRHFLIVNREDSFEPPKWSVAEIDERKNQKAFDHSFLGELLA